MLHKKSGDMGIKITEEKIKEKLNPILEKGIEVAKIEFENEKIFDIYMIERMQDNFIKITYGEEDDFFSRRYSIILCLTEAYLDFSNGNTFSVVTRPHFSYSAEGNVMLYFVPRLNLYVRGIENEDE